jgi:hypothetical protein
MPKKPTACPICPKEADLSAIATEVHGLTKTIEKLNERLFGNGQPGTIDKLEERLRLVENSRWKSIGEKAAYSAVGAAAGAILTAVAAWLAK